MTNNKRPSLFKSDNLSNGHFVISLSEDDIISIVTNLQYAHRMYKLTERVMREQGNDEQAEIMKDNAESAMEISNRILTDADPDYPTNFKDFV